MPNHSLSAAYLTKEAFPKTLSNRTFSSAFIGYTEFAQCDGDDIHLKAQPIHSLNEFEQFFGTAPALSITAHLDESNHIERYTIKNNYFLYESVKLFFANGGKHCVVVSVGGYDQAVVAGNQQHGLRAGFEILSLCNGTYLLAIPEAVLITNNANPTESFYAFQQEVISFCKNKSSHFALLDLQEDPCKEPQASQNIVDEVTLNHAMICSPWLKVNSASPLHLKTLKLTQSTSPISLHSLDPSNAVAELFDDFDKTLTNTKRVNKSIKRRTMGEANIELRYRSLLANYLTQPVGKQNNPPLRSLFTFLKGLAEDINNWICNCAIDEVVSGDLYQIIRQTIIPEIATKGLPTLIQLHSQAIEAGMVDAPVVGYREMFCLTSCNGNASPWQASDPTLAIVISDNPLKNSALLNTIFNHFDEAISVIEELNIQFESDAQAALIQHSIPLQQIYSELQCSRYIPPSGALMGIYQQKK